MNGSPTPAGAAGNAAMDTVRLSLRVQVPADLSDSVALWGDARVTRHIGAGGPLVEEEVWSRLLRNVGHWATLGFGYWAVRERATNKYVGEVGLADFHRAIQPSLAGTPECGWVLSPAFHGRGFATEAVRAVLAWSEQNLGPRTVCVVAAENTASVRVAEKCGYRQFASTMYHGAATLVFERHA